MLSSKPTLSHLLSKFSNANVIMVYFGNRVESQALMQALSAETRECWEANQKAFNNKFVEQRSLVRPLMGLSQSFVDYLLKHHQYQHTEIDIVIQDRGTFLNFDKYYSQLKEKIDIDIYKLRIYT